MPERLRLPAAGRGTAGQASVELVALLPLIALVAVAAWQLAVAGHAIWSVGAAARAAARADAVGADAEAAARARLTPALDASLRVRRDDGWVRVSVRVPEVLPVDLGRATARARFGADGA